MQGFKLPLSHPLPCMLTDFVALPTFTTFTSVFQSAKPILEMMQSNYQVGMRFERLRGGAEAGAGACCFIFALSMFGHASYDPQVPHVIWAPAVLEGDPSSPNCQEQEPRKLRRAGCSREGSSAAATSPAAAATRGRAVAATVFFLPA